MADCPEDDHGVRLQLWGQQGPPHCYHQAYAVSVNLPPQLCPVLMGDQAHINTATMEILSMILPGEKKNNKSYYLSMYI